MYRVYLADHFLRQLKRYVKKYRSLRDDLLLTLEHFHPETAQYLGAKLYKLRLRSRDLSKGKNKSFRLILFLVEMNNVVIPVTIYYKGDRSDVKEDEIEYHVSMVLMDIQQKKFSSR